MEDLRLYRLLIAVNADRSAGLEPEDVAALRSLLAQFAQREPMARRPLIGLLGPCLNHADARVRGAAVRALGGAEGHVGVSMIVRALDDGDGTVRNEAAKSLLRTVSTQPNRIAHLVFHPRPDVRRVLYDAALTPATRHIAAHRLADPAFEGSLASLELAPTAPSVDLVMALVASERLERVAARAWLLTARVQVLMGWAGAAPRRATDHVARTLQSEGGEVFGVDRLDRLFELFSAEAPAEERRLFHDRWIAYTAGHPLPMTHRVLAALMSANRPAWSAEALTYAALIDPQVLTWKRVPLLLRRAAARAFYRQPKPPHAPTALLDRLIDSELAWSGKTHLDLPVAGALSLLQTGGNYRWLVDKLGLDALRQAFLRDPVAAAPFLSLDDQSAEGRTWMIQLLLHEAEADAPIIFAIAATSKPTANLAFLQTAPPEIRLAIAGHLFTFETQPGLSFNASVALSLAEALAALLGASGDVLALWLDREPHAASNLGPAWLTAVSDSLSPEVLAALIAQLPTRLLRRALEVIDGRDLLTFAQARALGIELKDHPSTRIAEWAESKRTFLAEGASDSAFGAPVYVHDLPAEIADAIATNASLEASVRAAQSRCCRGLVAALRRRGEPARSSVVVAATLLGCCDDPQEVAVEFERFVEKRDGFLEALDAQAIKVAVRHPNPPLLLQCWLWRFERYGLAAGRAMVESSGGLTRSLRFASELPSDLLAQHGWAAAARSLAVWRRRSPERLAVLLPELDELLDLAIEQLDRTEGLYAARILRTIHEAKIDPMRIGVRLPRLQERLADLADEVRDELRTLISSDGLPSRVSGARAKEGRTSAAALRGIALCTDLALLERLCVDDVLDIVHEATLRLVGLGEAGQKRLAWLLARRPLPAHFEPIAASLPLWQEGDALDAVRFSLAHDPALPELRFRIAVGLCERGDDTLPAALEAALVPSRSRWFKRGDAEALRRLAEDPRALMRTLAASHHPPAYLMAVRYLKSRIDKKADDLAALRGFLEAGSQRLRELRLEVAEVLRQHGDDLGLPLLIEAGLAGEPAPDVLQGASEELVLATVESTLICARLSSDPIVLDWLKGLEPGLRERCLERLLAESPHLPTRSAALSRLPRRPQRARKLAALAEMFVWGTRVSRELTGGTLRPHLISGDELGYTRLNENRVFVTPLPFLRCERHGREIVEGLILHEIGHHRHHKGVMAQAIWTKAAQLGLGRLLNLVADEHLERNIRAFDEGYGNKLKRLDAYAFQHAARDVFVDTLLASFGARTFEVLSASTLDVAVNPRALRVNTASVLRELEKSGSSFARFARAMRMGLGDRFDDPKVREGLALFPRSFRGLDMRGLFKVTRELHRIFGDEIQLAFAYGGAESLEGDPFGDVTHGDEIGDAEIQREVERIQGRPDASAQRGGNRGTLQINVGDDETFETIQNIVRVAADPEEHRKVAQQVARHSRRLRTFLSKLGLSFEAQRMRLQGRRLDRTRLRALVTRADPRVLVAREPRFNDDLFLGLVIDCSGSMAGESMRRAHAFGALLTESVRGLPGVDLRIFGFTDQTIFDAGDARRPAVTALHPGGGNNDAAGLWHAAQVAMRSRRKAKVLVMISDGLPTECSVQALRGLVRQLSRRHGLVCAQVAVRPLEEICFPHYVEVDDAKIDGAVARFGRIIARLVGRSLRTP